MKMISLHKTCLHFLLFFIVITLQTPIYHQHVNDNHLHDPLKYTDYVAPHHPNDYSINSHRTVVSQNALPEKSHHTHNHAHYEKDLVRTLRIDLNKAKTIPDYTFDAFNNKSNNALALKKFSFDYYMPKYYGNNYAKTSSGLSPPRISV